MPPTKEVKVAAARIAWVANCGVGPLIDGCVIESEVETH
jgi:hypothetical protein